MSAFKGSSVECRAVEIHPHTSRAMGPNGSAADPEAMGRSLQLIWTCLQGLLMLQHRRFGSHQAANEAEELGAIRNEMFPWVAAPVP